jgi:DNA-binding NarL/FixJ family response regulator
MESLTKTKILVVHNSALMRFALVRVIEQNRRFEICAESDAAPTARKLFVQHQPQIILLGLTLCGGDGIELIKDFRKLDPTSCTVVLSGREDALSMQRAFRAGARGYLLDQDEIPEILMALDEVSTGSLYASPNVARRLLESLAIGAIEQGPSEFKVLSDRELQIFSLIGRGFGPSRLANELHLSVKTIETHEAHIKVKLGLGSAAELSEKATRWTLGSVRRNLQLKKQVLFENGTAPTKARRLVSM